MEIWRNISSVIPTIGSSLVSVLVALLGGGLFNAYLTKRRDNQSGITSLNDKYFREVERQDKEIDELKDQIKQLTSRLLEIELMYKREVTYYKEEIVKRDERIHELETDLDGISNEMDKLLDSRAELLGKVSSLELQLSE